MHFTTTRRVPTKIISNEEWVEIVERYREYKRWNSDPMLCMYYEIVGEFVDKSDANIVKCLYLKNGDYNNRYYNFKFTNTNISGHCYATTYFEAIGRIYIEFMKHCEDGTKIQISSEDVDDHYYDYDFETSIALCVS